MNIPEPGSYRAQQNGTVIIRQEESGSLMAYIPYALVGAAVNYAGVHNLTLGAKDGTPQTKNITSLKAVFPNWDADNLADIELPNEEGAEVPQFDLADCYHDDSYQPEGADSPIIQFRAKWFNPIGGGKKQPMTAEERKAALTRWKSKFKALGASKPAAAAPAKETKAAAPAPAPAKKAAVSGPPGRKSTAAQARTATQDEVWNGLVAANPDAGEDDLATKYYEACDAVVEGSSADPGVLTIQNWGAIADKLGI
jgi:hypothetical protein